MENEIKVNEYVRTIYGEIFKVFRTTKQNKKYVLVDGEVDRNQDRDANDSALEIKEIVKHSKDIIDLIEEGDYVNGEKINTIRMYANKKCVGVENSEEMLEACFDNDDIQHIVTHEQFEQIKYKVKE